MKSLNNERTSEWENHSIETFLEAAHEWAQISKGGLKFYDKPDNAWKRDVLKSYTWEKFMSKHKKEKRDL